MHSAAPDNLDTKVAGHWPQLVMLLVRYLPGAQFWHTVEPAAANVPTAQSLHHSGHHRHGEQRGREPEVRPDNLPGKND